MKQKHWVSVAVKLKNRNYPSVGETAIPLPNKKIRKNFQVSRFYTFINVYIRLYPFIINHKYAYSTSKSFTTKNLKRIAPQVEQSHHSAKKKLHQVPF